MARTIESLEGALSYAVLIIRSYEADMRNSEQLLTAENLDDLRQGMTLADIGFCQGEIYQRALGLIEQIANGEREPL